MYEGNIMNFKFAVKCHFEKKRKKDKSIHHTRRTITSTHGIKNNKHGRGIVSRPDKKVMHTLLLTHRIERNILLSDSNLSTHNQNNYVNNRTTTRIRGR